VFRLRRRSPSTLWACSACPRLGAGRSKRPRRCHRETTKRHTTAEDRPCRDPHDDRVALRGPARDRRADALLLCGLAVPRGRRRNDRMVPTSVSRGQYANQTVHRINHTDSPWALPPESKPDVSRRPSPRRRHRDPPRKSLPSACRHRLLHHSARGVHPPRGAPAG